MKHLYGIGALCVAASLLVACGGITRGEPIDHGRLASFQPGVTTLDEVERSLGPPQETTREPGGETYLKYLYATARFSKYAQIPVVSAFARRGHAIVEGDTVYLHFDAAGRLLDTTEYAQHHDTRDPLPGVPAGSVTH